MEFSRPEYWSEYLLPSAGDLPNPGIKPRSPTLQADSLPAEPPGKPKNTAVGSPIPSPGDLPDPGIEPGSPTLQVDSLPAKLPAKPLREPMLTIYLHTPSSVPMNIHKHIYIYSRWFLV